MDFSNTPGYRGGLEIGLNAWLIGFSSLFYGLRLYIRVFITKSPGLDDGIAGIAYLLLMALSVMDIRAVSLGSGTHEAYVPEDIKARFFQWLGIQTVIYYWAIGLVRFAILAFLPRLTQDRSIRLVSWSVAVLLLTHTIIAFTLKLTQCTPIADSFKPPLEGRHCAPVARYNDMMLGHGIGGIVLDAILLLLPIWVICRKMMWSKKTLQIVLVLSVGVFAMATSIVRVVLMASPEDFSDMTYAMPSLGIWTNLEGHVGLWCSCFPALQPLLRVVPYKLRQMTLGTSGGTRATVYTHDKLGSRQDGTRGVYKERIGSSAGMDNESQRAIVSLEMGKMDAEIVHAPHA